MCIYEKRKKEERQESNQSRKIKIENGISSRQ